MNLYLLRHGKAEEKNLHRYASDDERPLTEEGIRDIKSAAKGMKALKLSFDLILSSPYVRARETAEIVADILKLKKHLQLTSLLKVEAEPNKIIRELERYHSDLEDILLVGHEPFMSRLTARLISGKEFVSLGFRKGSLAKLHTEMLMDDSCAALEWFMTPKQLIKLGKA